MYILLSNVQQWPETINWRANMTTYTKPENNMELVKRASTMIVSGQQGFKQLMAKKAKEIASTKTQVIIDSLVSDYMATNMHDIKKDFSPNDFALWSNMEIDKL